MTPSINLPVNRNFVPVQLNEMYVVTVPLKIYNQHIIF